MSKIVDARGDNCPIPVVKAKKALEETKGAGVIEVWVDNEIASVNVEKFALGMKLKSEVIKISENEYHIIIHNENAGEFPGCEEMYFDKSGTVVVISSDCFGSGDEELGKILMKSYIYALSQRDILPDTLILLNSGVTLSTVNEDIVGDLREMEQKGVEIFSCGTCLEYYKLKDQLKVGSVTNMYAIVQKMDEAGKVINL